MQIVNFGLRIHINMSNQGIRVDAGTINAPGNILHGKTFLRIITTPKKGGMWGKGKVTYKIDDKGAPEFDDIEKFNQHYKIQNDEKSDK